MNFFSFILKNKFPNRETRKVLLGGAPTTLSLLFYTWVAIAIVLFYLIIISINNSFLVSVPAKGGTLREGVIGAPQFINPVLATTTTDTALTHLVFAGLMKELADGTIVPELATDYTLSPDNRSYTFTLREGLTFHNGSPVTAHDVAFTIGLMQNPLINAHDAMYWNALTTTVSDEKTITITLPDPDTHFLQKITLGILPASEWNDIPPETFATNKLNLKAIGAGPFAVSSITYNDNLPSEITLSRNRHYPLGTPLLKKVTIKIYANQQQLLDAVEGDDVDFTVGLDAKTIKESSLATTHTITAIPSRSVVGIYRHEGSSALSYAPLLSLLNDYIDKMAILATVDNGYGIPYAQDATSVQSASLEETQSSLTKLGYSVTNGVLTKGGVPVALSIATLSDERYTETARSLIGQLAGLGVLAEVKAFDSGMFQDELARGSFALVLTKQSDQLPASYTTSIPLYYGATLFVTNKRAHGVTPSLLQSPTLRYAQATTWHERTERIYRWFIKKE